MKFNFKLHQIKRGLMSIYGLKGLIMLEHHNLIKPCSDKVIIPHGHAYVKTYEGEIEDENIHEALESIFQKFNLDHPSDFDHYSMSVGDIVEIDGNKFFCDSWGFKEVEVNFK